MPELQWLVSVTLLFAAGSICLGEPFTDDTAILAVEREPQEQMLQVGALKEELVLSQVIEVLTVYVRSTREDYMRHHHTLGAKGTVRLKGGLVFAWNIEPDSAARLTDAKGDTIYLLHPKLVESMKAVDKADEATPMPD